MNLISRKHWRIAAAAVTAAMILAPAAALAVTRAGSVSSAQLLSGCLERSWSDLGAALAILRSLPAT